jgi:hypothetical protein
MGYYIDVDSSGHALPTLGKADHLIQYEDAIVLQNPTEFVDGMICVANNGFFEAAAFIFCEGEFDAFHDLSDTRRKTWLRLDPEKAKKLAGYSQ